MLGKQRHKDKNVWKYFWEGGRVGSRDVFLPVLLCRPPPANEGLRFTLKVREM